MEPLQKETINLDVRQIIGVMLQRIWIILFSGVTVGLLFMIHAKATAVPLYTSSTKLYVLSKSQDTTDVNSVNFSLSATLAQDYMQLITSRTVMESVISELGLNMRAESLANKISVTMPENSSRMIVISVTDTDPYVAQKLTAAVQEMAIERIQDVMDTGAVNVIEEANIPQSMNTVNLKRNGMIGGAVGVAIAMGIIFLLFIMNDTVRTAEDVERYLNLSVLGSIPMSDEERKRGRKKSAKSARAKETRAKETKAKETKAKDVKEDEARSNETRRRERRRSSYEQD